MWIFFVWHKFLQYWTVYAKLWNRVIFRCGEITWPPKERLSCFQVSTICSSVTNLVAKQERNLTISWFMWRVFLKLLMLLRDMNLSGRHHWDMVKATSGVLNCHKTLSSAEISLPLRLNTLFNYLVCFPAISCIGTQSFFFFFFLL